MVKLKKITCRKILKRTSIKMGTIKKSLIIYYNIYKRITIDYLIFGTKSERFGRRRCSQRLVSVSD
jgi:hypothetical protein